MSEEEWINRIEKQIAELQLTSQAALATTLIGQRAQAHTLAEEASRHHDPRAYLSARFEVESRAVDDFDPKLAGRLTEFMRHALDQLFQMARALIDEKR